MEHCFNMDLILKHQVHQLLAKILKYTKFNNQHFQAGISGTVSQTIRDESFSCKELLRQYIKAAFLLDIINGVGNVSL